MQFGIHDFAEVVNESVEVVNLSAEIDDATPEGANRTARVTIALAKADSPRTQPVLHLS
jgi:hypothetical protein